jgi:Trypsin-like peptidase domain
MKKIIVSLVTVCVWAVRAFALDPTGDPGLAVVRIHSHGASGTIIATTEQKSYILSCAHMFFGKDDRVDPERVGKRIAIDGPTQPYAKKNVAPLRVLAIDADLDLSLLEINNGPFNYIPVAPKGFRPGSNVTSAGYDNMSWPITHKRATIVDASAGWTFTKEKPWHGRSGGGLFDLDAKRLIGVVNGYEINHGQRGIYVSHDAVFTFVFAALGKTRQTPPLLQSFPQQRFLQPGCPGGLCPIYPSPCPGGVCPR